MTILSLTDNAKKKIDELSADNKSVSLSIKGGGCAGFEYVWNVITENDIEFVIFTVTSDITEAFPAKAFREIGMTSIAAIDTLAPNINSDLSGCIRILIYLNKDLEEINHAYLDDAKKLRPDR